MILEQARLRNAETPLIESPSVRTTPAARPSSQLRVFMMDLACIIPYYVGYLAKALQEEGVDVTIGSIDYYLDPGCFRRQGLTNHPGALDAVRRWAISRPWARRGMKTAEYLVNLAATAIRFRTDPPDVLHVQFLPLAKEGLSLELLFLRWARSRGIRIVYTVHNVLPQGTGRRLQPLYARIYELADRLICQTEEARKRLVSEFRTDPERIDLIPHGVMFADGSRPSPAEARARLGVSPGSFVVLWQGIIQRYKGAELLLEAWEQVARQVAGALLVVAGTGDAAYLKALSDQIRTLNIEGSVRCEFRFVPFEEVPVFLQAADVVVYPYREISTSGALMTGLAFEKAVVATSLPAFREVIESGRTGILVEPENPRALGVALIRLAEHPEERASIAERAGALFRQQYAWNAIARKTREVYEKIL